MEKQDMSIDSPRSGLAVASLSLGIASFFPLVGVVLGATAVILGIIAYFQIKKSGYRGKRFTIAGIILGVLGIFFTFTLYGSLYYFGFHSKTGPFVQMKRELAQRVLTQNAGALELYKSKEGMYPQTIDHESLVRDYSIIPIDPFLNPFHYEVSDDGESYVMRSTGVDGVYDTEDDISLEH